MDPAVVSLCAVLTRKRLCHHHSGRVADQAWLLDSRDVDGKPGGLRDKGYVHDTANEDRIVRWSYTKKVAPPCVLAHADSREHG